LSRPLALDLYTGRGGFARAFVAAGYRVVGVDILPRPADYPEGAEYVQADMRTFDATPYKGARLVVASPPCTGYSIASRHVRAGLRPAPLDFELLAHALRAIGQAGPAFWAVENVGNAVPHFRPILGEPAFANAPWFLWGNFPPFVVGREKMLKGFTHRGNGGHKVYGNASKKKRAAMAAEIPHALAGPLAEACYG
jgi:hypothetical protein